jgi:hypothetical protein
LIKTRGRTTGVAMVLLAAENAGATTWNNQQIAAILPPDSRNCVMFTMVGVSTADPVVNQVPWIGIPAEQTGFSQIYAFLLWAKATGTAVNVTTSGALAGGTCTAGGNVVGLTQVYAPM